MKTEFPKTLYGFYWMVIKKFKFYFWSVFFLGVLGITLDMVMSPLTLKWITGIFENALIDNYSYVLNLFILLGVLFILPLVISCIKQLFRAIYQQVFHRYKLFLLYKRVYENDISYFLDYPTGQISSQVMEVSGKLEDLMEVFWGRIIGTVLGFAFIIGAVFKMNVWFVVILILYGIVKVIWEWYIQKKIKRNNELQVDEVSKYAGLRSDSLRNALVVKWFANTEYENKYIFNGRARLIKIIKTAYILDMWQWIPSFIVWVISRLGILLLCFFMVKNGELSISNAIFVMASAQSINNSFENINAALRRYSTNLARAKKAYSNIIVEQVVTDKENAKKLSLQDAEISFEHVDFSYGQNRILHDFNLCVKKREKVGIVGLSGAGKSTLINLLLRMYDVDNGAIKINGIDIRDVKQDSLRRNISFVPQEASLFNRTIMQNIKYANPEATKEQVIKVSKKAGIHDMVMRQPKGYNTLVGNNGIKLSGGEKQRVSIARALLKNAPILVLDEATSALDSKNEVLIQQSLGYAMHNKTTLVIAHRLSTMRNMDRIIVLKKGKIIESGSHNQLLRRGGEYAALWKMQVGIKK